MRKIFCDACNREMKGSDYHNLQYLCHIDEVIKGSVNLYVDSEHNYTSGRYVKKDLCNKCYNAIMIPAVRAIQDMPAHQEETTNDNT